MNITITNISRVTKRLNNQVKQCIHIYNDKTMICDIVNNNDNTIRVWSMFELDYFTTDNTNYSVAKKLTNKKEKRPYVYDLNTQQSIKFLSYVFNAEEMQEPLMIA